MDELAVRGDRSAAVMTVAPLEDGWASGTFATAFCCRTARIAATRSSRTEDTVMRSSLLAIAAAAALTLSAAAAGKHTLLVLSHNNHTGLRAESGERPHPPLVQGARAAARRHRLGGRQDGVRRGAEQTDASPSSTANRSRKWRGSNRRCSHARRGSRPTPRPAPSRPRRRRRIIALTTDGSKLYVGLENADVPVTW